MRTLTVNLYPNDGIGTTFAAQGLTGKLASMGKLSWAIDDQLTKIQPGTLSLKVWDDDGSLWTWVQGQIQTTVASKNQFFAPWLTLDVNGTRAFFGVVDLPSVQRDFRSGMVEFQAQDWSVMLRDQSLDTWTRPFPKVVSTRTGTSLGTGSRILLTPANWLPTSSVKFASDVSGLVQVGDFLQFNGSGPGYKVLSLSVISGSVTYVLLDGFNWGASTSGTWTRLSSSVGDQAYYSVASTVTGTQDAPLYEIPVDTVDWLVPGDVLERPGKGRVPVDDIDAERKLIISATPITETFTSGDRLVLTTDSKLELVQQDALLVMKQAVAPFDLDVSGFTPPTISTPAFAWLPWYNRATGDNLRGICDIEPTLTQLRLMGGGYSWAGTPEAGFTVSAGTASRNVDWTCQRTSAPSMLMPDQTPGLAPRARDRNRAYSSWKFVAPKLLDSNWDPTTPDDSPVAGDVPPLVLAHDYAAFRRWKLTAATWTEERWSGSAWSAPAGVTPSTASGGPWTPLVAAPFPTVAATTGPTPLGKALLVLASNAGGTYQLQLHFVGASAAVCSVPAAQAVGARIVCTPFGAYLVGPGGYGKISYSAGTLSLAWAQVVDASTCWLQPNTLCALDASSLWVLARMDWRDPDDGNKHGSETRLFNLVENPSGASTIILNGTDGLGVRIASLPPRICSMLRDPSDSTRLVGIFGSRLFQIAPRLPATIERIKAQGMTSAELVEHVCQAINAIVYPLPTGSLKLVPRSAAGGTTALTVDQVEVTQARVSQHFFSVVRVSGADDSVYADASGTWAGGRSLEVNSHPMIHGEAQAYALATTLVSFFGRPRRQETQKWFYADADSAPPWESLAPFCQLTVNGGGTTWILTSLQADLVKGDAQAVLLEA